MTAALAAAFFAVLTLSSSALAQDQGSPEAPFAVDQALAKTGKNVWSAKGCMACHTIGKAAVAAPDLNGLYERRDPEWIKRWLKDPESMYETDDTIKAMIEQWNGLRMPDMKLTDAEITALMHYMAEQQTKKK